MLKVFKFKLKQTELNLTHNNSTFIIENSSESGKTKGWKRLQIRTGTSDKIKFIMAIKTVLNLVVDTMLMFYLIYVLLWNCRFLLLHYMSSPEVTHLTFIWVMFSLNLGQDTSYPN
jgi:hypothetical protein